MIDKCKQIAKEIIYVANPMCSWCYGFSPVIEKIREDYANKVDNISLKLGPLSHGEMKDDLREFLRGCWEDVHESTGAEFQHDFFARQGFIYDSTNACKAVYAAKELGSTEAAFQLFRKLQEAFYRNNRDITDIDTLIQIASEIPIDKKTFTSKLKDEIQLEEMVTDSEWLKENNIIGYPTILLSDKKGMVVIEGYKQYETFVSLMDEWFNRES